MDTFITIVVIIVVLGIIALVLALIFSNIKIVPQSYEFVIEKLGKYSKTWKAGIHVKTPFIARIANKVSLKEQVLDTPPQPVITKDNVTIQIDAIVYYHIFDSKLFTYGAANPILALGNLSATTLRNIIGSLTLDEALTSRETINAKLTAVLDEATDPWGIRVGRVEIKNLEAPHEIRVAMEKQMRAERDRRQTVLEAEGHKESVITRAEGDKQAKVLAAEAERDAQIALAEGKAKSIKMIYEAEAEGLRLLNEVAPSDGVLKLKGIEALKDVADGRATKIFMPSDITNVVAGLGVAGEALGIGTSTRVDASAKPEPEIKDDPCIRESTGAGGIEAYHATEEIRNDIENRK